MIIVDNEMCECGAEKQVKEGRIIPEFICQASQQSYGETSPWK